MANMKGLKMIFIWILVLCLMTGDIAMADLKEKMSMKIPTMETKDFSNLFDKLEGISQEQLKQHNQLYEKYVGKVNEINGKLTNADLMSANQNYSEFRSLKVELAHNLNGAILHEFYFSNLTPDYKEPPQELKDMIEQDFASWNDYIEDLKATGVASRAGWAITGYNYRDGKVYNFAIDQHDIHVPAYVRPLLVIDTWEHAFMIDYGIDKKAYIKAFFANVDWQVMLDRYKSTLQTEDLLEKSTK